MADGQPFRTGAERRAATHVPPMRGRCAGMHGAGASACRRSRPSDSGQRSKVSLAMAANAAIAGDYRRGMQHSLETRSDMPRAAGAGDCAAAAAWISTSTRLGSLRAAAERVHGTAWHATPACTRACRCARRQVAWRPVGQQRRALLCGGVHFGRGRCALFRSARLRRSADADGLAQSP